MKKLSQHYFKHLPTIGVTILGFSTVIFFFHPGFMTNDPTIQLAEARSGLYTDLHPPIMAWVWHFLDQIIPGPFGMLVFHNLMFWFGLALWAHLLFKESGKSAAFVLGFGFFPPIFSLLGMIWKDVAMGAALLLGTALLHHFEKKRNRWALTGSIFCLFYSLAVRPNAALAVLPLVFWMGKTMMRSLMQTIGFVFMVLIVAQTLVWVHTSWVVDGRKQYGYQPILIYDIAAISSATGENGLPDYLKKLNQNLTIDLIRQRYNTYDVAPLVFTDGIYQVQNSEEIHQLWRKWWHALSQHPWIYLKHRIKFFIHFLGFGNGAREIYSAQVEEAIPLLEKIRSTFLFRNGTYILATFILFLIAWFQQWQPEPYIAASGLFYALQYLLVGPGCSFRYCWWTVISSILTAILILKKIKSLNRHLT